MSKQLKSCQFRALFAEDLAGLKGNTHAVIGILMLQRRRQALHPLRKCQHYYVKIMFKIQVILPGSQIQAINLKAILC